MLPVPHNCFSYDLGIKVIPSKVHTTEVTLCCHGYGHNNHIVDTVATYHALPGNLIGFNFPDHDITSEKDHHKSAFGSIDEILPLLYLIKYYACDVQLPVINLYGFSAGGGAVVNALAVLNQYRYQERLESLGITRDKANQMVQALERGLIVLDCPLKSIEEIIAVRGSSPELEIMRVRYSKNTMNPIDALSLLTGSHLNIILYFQDPDDVLGNRDDTLFIERLQKANKANTHVIIGADGGHNSYHAALWHYLRHVRETSF